MDIGDYYSKSFDGFAKNPNLAIPAFLGNVIIYVAVFLASIISFLVIAGPGLLNGNTISPDSVNYGSALTITVIIALIVLIMGITYSFIYAATIGMSRRIIEGEKPKLDVGLKYGRKYLLKIFLVSIILGILWILASIPIALGLIINYIYHTGFILTIIGLLVTLALYVLVGMLFIFTYQSVVIGKKSVLGSFKDSFKVFKKRIFEVVVVLIINAVIIGVINLGLFFAGAILGIIPIIGTIFSAILSIVIGTLILPYFTLVLTYLYMDLKEMPI